MSTDREPPRHPHPAETSLHRFVDGDAAGDERVAIEALLAADDEALDATRTFQHQNVLLQALHPRRPEDRMLPPAALNLARGLRRRRTWHRSAAASVALAALLGAGTAGWHAQAFLERRLQTPVVQVFPADAGSSAGETAAPEAGAAMAPVPTATGGFTGNAPGWLGNEARRVPVHPPNLQEVGYQLVDGRADLTAYGPVIRFAYTPSEGGDGPRLALTVASFGTDRQSLATTINPQHASLFWQSGPLLYALSGDLAPARLATVAGAVGPLDATPSKPAAEPAAAAGAERRTPDGPALEVNPLSDQNEPSKEL